MKFHIPFTISAVEKLKKQAQIFNFLAKKRKPSKLKLYLENSGLKVTEKEYFAIALRSLLISFILLYILATTALVLAGVNYAYLFSLLIAIIFSGFVFFSQMIYPKVFNSRRVKNLERNLIPGLQDMFIQLNSGIPLFNILVNISSSSYGALSEEFKKAVKRINAGLPQIKVLEELSKNNPSKYFKRTLWQLSNGMRAGSDISIVIEESIKTLNEEQLIQIQNYGNKLNPMIMFYMVTSIILPALSITFLTVISSMLSLPKNMTTLLFIGLLVFTVLLQIVFLGVIKSIRPSLL